jgi:hypothetical protein
VYGVLSRRHDGDADRQPGRRLELHGFHRLHACHGDYLHGADVCGAKRVGGVHVAMSEGPAGLRGVGQFPDYRPAGLIR